MRKFRSLTRLLIFYALSLLIMLIFYYAMMFSMLKTNSQQYSQMVFDVLHHKVTENIALTDTEMVALLDKPFFREVSYQIILMLPSGQSYVHRYTRPQEQKFTSVVFPSLAMLSDPDNNAYQLTNHTLTGAIKLKGGHQVYVVLRHKPIDINWLSYQYWLPLMIAFILFTVVLMYLSKRRLNWLQLLHYIEDLTTTAKDAYTLSPFAKRSYTSTPEFLRLGNALGRISYQLHANYRHIKTLSHRLEHLVDQAPLPMLMVMREGQISFFNQRFEQVFTTTFQRDTNYSLTDFVTGSDKATQQLLQKLSLQRVTRTLLVYGLDNKQAYQLHITPWFGEHGQVHGFTVLINNVDTFIKQVDKLKSQNQQLDIQIKEFTQLKSIIGHELRTPLSAIIGTLNLIDSTNYSIKQQDILHTLKQSSHSMLAMLNDTLDVAKIEAGKTQIVNEATDIFKLNQHIIDLMAGNARQKNIELLYLFMPECPRFIDTDAKRLQQIILNLMNNAIKFTTSGYVALVIEPVTQQQIAQTDRPTSSPQLYNNDLSAVNDLFAVSKSKTLQRLNKDLAKRLSTKDNQSDSATQHHWIRFSVIDTGIGIDEAEQHTLFSYFNQANAKISHKFGGTGLGLAISNSLAQLLGGFIQLDSDGSSGSTFVLYLPCRAPTYKPAYHFQTELTPIYLIALVKHDIYVTYLQRLFQHLSISADVYTISAAPNVDQLIEKLEHKGKTFSPLLILDYEDREINIKMAAEPSESTLKSFFDENIASEMPYRDLDDLLAMPLPKILLSMKPERSIPSLYLDQFDGFLNRPLDVTSLLSEIIRLTQPKLLANSASVTTTASEILSSTADEELSEQVPSTTKTSVKDIKTQDKLRKSLILVVEDNLINQKIACKLLDRLGYQTIVAQNGRQALQQLVAAQQQVALVLMDCRMPVMDGMEATRAIRAQGNSIPVVALTANNSVEDREACYTAGMDEFLTKPINKDQLNEVLQRLINV